MPCMVVKGSSGSTAVSSGSPAGQDHQANLEFVFFGELVVALVVGGHAHDGAGAVVHEDVVGHPDRNLFAVVGIDGVAAGVDAVLFDLADVADFPGLALLGDQLIDCGTQQVVVLGQTGDQRMLGRELQRGRAENRVDAGGEDGDGRSGRIGGAVEFEIHQRAFAAADPVALHGADFFRPAGQAVEIAQQFVGIVGDAQKPLLEFALLDQGVFVAPAAAVHHLLVGQHGGAFRTPVDPALLAIGQALLEELDEEPLVPFVVFGQTGGDFARPVVGEAQALHLRLHGGDVAQRPLARRRVVLDGGVFRGQAEGIPAHGMKHVVAVHPHVAGEGVADGVVAHVSHVQRAGGIGQHFEHVILRLGGVRLGGVERRILLPALEPFGLDAVSVVAVVVLAVAAASRAVTEVCSS